MRGGGSQNEAKPARGVFLRWRGEGTEGTGSKLPVAQGEVGDGWFLGELAGNLAGEIVAKR